MKRLVGVALVVIVVLVLVVRVLHRSGRLRKHGREHAGRHGGADQSPKDQHHHQNQSQAATHAVNDTARAHRFPWPGANHPRGEGK